MRTLRYLAAITSLGLSLGACKWTEFDDLEKDAWVGVTGKPNGESADYGVAVQRGARQSASGGKLVVIGAGDAQYTEIVYATNGDSDLAPTALKLNNQFGVGNLDPQPILIADPTSDEVALVTNAGGQSIAILSGVGGLVARQAFGPEQPDAAAYMLAPPRADTAVAHPSQPIVASGDSVYGTFYMNAPLSQTKCQLLDEVGMPMQIRGVGGVANTTTPTTDDLVVWSAVGNVGKLLLYPGGVFNGQLPVGPCAPANAGTSGPLMGSMMVETSFVPGKGSQIIMIDRKYALLVGKRDNGDGFLALYDVTATSGGMRVPARIGTPVDEAELRSAAILDTGSEKYVVAGYPGATVEAVKAGKVLVYPLDLVTGIDATPAMTLHDAQPEADQFFGRTVAVTPFNGKNVIAVGADNEVFLYFRTLLYDDTRQ